MQLETYEWQAKGFYKKVGFTTVATVPNRENSSGSEHYYMRKIVQ